MKTRKEESLSNLRAFLRLKIEAESPDSLAFVSRVLDSMQEDVSDAELGRAIRLAVLSRLGVLKKQKV